MQCDSPLTIKPKYYDKIGLLGIAHKHRTYSAPCGVCPNCKRNRINEWAFRLKQEEKRSGLADFICLTYETQHMPHVWVPYHKKNMGTLSTDHLKNFWKHLRQLEKRSGNNKKIKYYAAGEYGTENTMRPHYHAIIFNVDNKENYWKAWGKGMVDIDKDPAGIGSMAYTAKYIDKKSLIHSDDPRQKQFSRMSQKLGDNYLTTAMVKYHRAKPTERNFVTYYDGVKQRMPDYYRKKIFSNVERHKQALWAEELAKEKPEYDDTNLEHDLKKQTLVHFNHLTKKRS